MEYFGSDSISIYELVKILECGKKTKKDKKKIIIVRE